MSVTCADEVPALRTIDARGAGATLPVIVDPLSPKDTPFLLENASVATTPDEAPAVTASSPPPMSPGSMPSATTCALASFTRATISTAMSVYEPGLVASTFAGGERPCQ